VKVDDSWLRKNMLACIKSPASISSTILTQIQDVFFNDLAKLGPDEYDFPVLEQCAIMKLGPE